jgi:hypothetical protein
MSYAICTRRFSRKLFENAVELRERLEPNRKRNLADAKIAIVQKPARVLEARARNVIHKIYACDLLKLLAEMIGTNVDRFCYLSERKFFGRMFLDELSRLPDFDRLGSMAVARRLGRSICDCRYHCMQFTRNWRR